MNKKKKIKLKEKKILQVAQDSDMIIKKKP
ncbi:hypothetical protein SAMN05216349_1207 [Oribacterium sp. KHPX15]|nr:hypothetical protein SAMN05216349_1207 [Oribacterium sp. KHPX15]